jgi:hypothetical protein
MAVFGQSVNQDAQGVKTSAVYGNRGDGTSEWYETARIFDGGNVTQGARADAAVTDPTASGSLVALLKGILSFLRVSAAGLGKAEDAVAVSGDTGVMALAVRRDTPTSDAAAGDYHALHVDALGRLRVVEAARELTNATTTALASSLVVKATPGTLYGIQGYTTAAQFIHLYNATSLPADAAVPVVVIPVEADKPFSIDFGKYGRAFSTGIVVGNSTTGPTKTLGAANTWIDAQYE